MTSANDIATAPGDLPTSEVIARFQALEAQFRHDNTIEPLAPAPGEPIQVFATSGARMPVQRASLYYTTDGSLPDEASAQVEMQAQDTEWGPLEGLVMRWRGTIPGQPVGTTVRYRIGGWLDGGPDGRGSAPDIWANDGQGFWFRYPGTEGITTFAFPVEPPRDPLPAWMSEAVIYQIFLDRFHPGTPDGMFEGGKGPTERHGGTLRGVQQSLSYLADLGVTCLWLSPHGPAETYHRYDTMDYFGVDPVLGTVDDMRELVAEAHRRGIRIWLDFVPSHASWHHPAFLAAQQDQLAPSYSWFTFNRWPDDYRCFLQRSRQLPSINTEDPGARAHLVEAAQFWLRDVGVDGYRLDHAIGPSMDFWTALRTATQAVKDDVVLVGEATDTVDCLRRYRARLHGILDFPLARALRSCFGAGSWDLAQLDTFLTSYERYMSDGPGRVSFLDNHDMDRFLWVAGNDIRLLKMAAVCQLTLDATPVVYYGTEIGMTQEHGAAEAGFGGDSQARRDMPWNESAWDKDLLSFYRALIHLRRAQPALQRGGRKTVALDVEMGTYAYIRASRESNDGVPILAAFNLGDQERQVRFDTSDVHGTVTCLLATGAEPGINHDGVSIALAPMTAAVLALEDPPPG